MKRVLIASVVILLPLAPQIASAHSARHQADGMRAYQALGNVDAFAPRRAGDGVPLEGSNDGSRDTATGGPAGGLF